MSADHLVGRWPIDLAKGVVKGCLSLRSIRTTRRERQPQQQMFDDQTLVYDGFAPRCGCGTAGELADSWILP